MAKSLKKIEARVLRQKGNSINDIADKLEVSKSTVSLWCRDIYLTKRQVGELIQKKGKFIRQGQINAALIKKQKRLDKIDNYKRLGVERFKKMAEEEIFTAGLMLYLGEGSKRERIIAFVNSDPEVIAFMIRWFRYFFDVSKDRFILSVLINKIHKKRDVVIRRYWSKYLNIPIEQFRKTIFVKSKQLKIYENYDNYYGTLRFRLLKSTDLFYKIEGLIEGLISSASDFLSV